MMLAETLPDPNHFSSIGWVIVILAAIAFGANAVLDLVDRMRGKSDKPTQIEQPLSVTGTPLSNAEIQRDLKTMNHRLIALENWRGQLMDKLDVDKTEVIAAGEHRAEKIHDRINLVLASVSELRGQVNEISKNCKACQ